MRGRFVFVCSCYARCLPYRRGDDDSQSAPRLGENAQSARPSMVKGKVVLLQCWTKYPDQHPYLGGFLCHGLNRGIQRGTLLKFAVLVAETAPEFWFFIE